MSDLTIEILDGLANVGLSREEHYRLIDVLYERAAALPLDTTNGAWYCRECGSTNVHLISWVIANENLRDAGSDSPDDDTWCEDCEEHGTAFHSEEPPLFCACLIESENGEQPQATWTDEERGANCVGCGQPYMKLRPGPADEEAIR